jgi:hypothetical protein
MGLKSLFGRKQETDEVAPAELATCPHTTLTPRWDRAEDIGKHDLATAYRCEGCGHVFSREEVDHLRRTETERVRETMPTA